MLSIMSLFTVDNVIIQKTLAYPKTVFKTTMTSLFVATLGFLDKNLVDLLENGM